LENANLELKDAIDSLKTATDLQTATEVATDKVVADKLATVLALATATDDMAKIAQEKAILAKEAQDNALENPTQENVDLAKTAQENATKASENAINSAMETQNALDDYLQSVTMASEIPVDTSAIESSIDNANDKAQEAKVAVDESKVVMVTLDKLLALADGNNNALSTEELNSDDLAILGLDERLTTPQEIALFNDILDNAVAGDINTLAKIQTLADIADKIIDLANGGTPTITQAELELAGMNDLTPKRTVVLLETIASKGDVDVDSLAEIQALVDVVAPIAPSVDIVVSSDSGSSHTDNITKDNTPTITGVTEPRATVSVKLADGTVIGSAVADENGAYSITTLSIADGVQTLSVEAEDRAGNISTTTQKMTIDTTMVQPQIDIADASDSGSLNNDNITNDTTPAISGTAEAGSTVIISNASGVLGVVVADENGKYSFTTPELSDGVHDLTITVEDLAGNRASNTQQITIDTVVNNATIDLIASDDSGSSSTDDITNHTTPTIEGVAEAGSRVIVSVDGQM